MAIGTAALIIILSIYNGFDNIVRKSLSEIEPDILIKKVKGKVFIPDDKAFEKIYNMEAVYNMCSILQENVYISYENHTGVAKAKGVDFVYEEESPIRKHIVDGKFSLHKGQIPLSVVGAGLAYKLGINPRFLSPVILSFPSKKKSFSVSSPVESIESITTYPSGIFSVNTDIDEGLLIVPIEKLRELLGYDKEVSEIEIRLRPNSSNRELRNTINEISKILGPDFSVKDRFRQNESLYKMMKYEKIVVWLILVFIIVIIAFNIFGSLSMLMIEKDEDINTLRSMGAESSLIRRIFVLEGWMISLLGMFIGIVCGLAFVYAQQYFGFIKMPGNFMVSAYPVIPKFADIAITALSVAGVGYIIALLPTIGRLHKSGQA